MVFKIVGPCKRRFVVWRDLEKFVLWACVEADAQLLPQLDYTERPLLLFNIIIYIIIIRLFFLQFQSQFLIFFLPSAALETNIKTVKFGNELWSLVAENHTAEMKRVKK